MSSIQPALLRAEPHAAVGAVIRRDAGVIIERWARRAEEQPGARRLHHDDLLDHLPTLLWQLGSALADAGPDPVRHLRSANVHGDQRWQVGWSVEEVVRDYQLLRLVIADHLNEHVGRPLSAREAMAVGVFIDDAIAASVAAYTACLTAAAAGTPGGPGAAARDGRHDDLFGFLGVLGHELRNPLAPLGNALQVLARAPGDAAVVERARALMDRQFRVMTRLVDDLLDLPRLRTGKLQLKPGRLDLAALARDVAGDRRAAFDAAGVALTVDAPADPVWTSGDAGRLNQVLGNLLGNALKFTDRGGEVVVRLACDGARQVAVLAVRDTGIGIEPAVLPTVFEPFVQADRSVARSRGGLGLGLALVRGMIELHGGTVTAASGGPGGGSTFTVELPLIGLPPAAAAPAPAATPGVRRNVLVIEDNQDSAESLKEYLELLGHTVAACYSGASGVARAKAEPPDVVVCDIGLPGMSGYAVCAELKAVPALAGTLFVALSGHAPDESAESAVFDMHLLKPVDPPRLAAVIAAGKPKV